VDDGGSYSTGLVRGLIALLALALIASTGLSCGKSPRDARGFNLVLVTIDTVRADHFGCYGGNVETPALDRLAREGVRFAQATSAVPLTLPSHATMLTGLLPPHHGLRNNGAGTLPEGTATLATRLAGAGYATAAFVGAFVLDHRFGLARGFDVYDDQIQRGDRTGADALEAERRGDAVVDRALAWIEGRSGDPRPYFLWIHLYDAHAPYEPPEPFRSRYREQPYSGEVAFVDAQVERILSTLDRRKETPRTVVVAVADHGEALGEHGEATHGLLLYQPTLHVPLLVRAPGVVPAASVLSGAVSLADLAPTLASLLGVPSDGKGLDGRDLSRSLVGGKEPEVEDVYAETEYPRLFGWSGIAAVRRGAKKYISAPTRELYDLASDPGEARNLASGSTEIEDLQGAIARLGEEREGRDTRPATLDAQTREKLASLGYVGGTPSPSAGGRDPKDAAPLFREFEAAHRAMRAGRIAEAVLGLEHLLADDPRNPVFCDVLAQAERQRGNLDRAIALHREAIALRPEDNAVRYELALALQEAGRPEDATAALTEAIRRDPGFPEAHNALGITLAATGRSAEALAQFERAAALDPKDSRAHNNRGNALRELGRLPEAGQAYARAVELDPTYADPHSGLGAVALATSDFTGAITQFDRALALAPEEHEILVNRGIALQMLGRIDEARASYRSFLAKSGNAPAFAQARAATEQLLARLDAGPAGARIASARSAPPATTAK
jgi:arylsulfatase A-like enzyme/Tfp pilus assembly protein PilF